MKSSLDKPSIPGGGRRQVKFLAHQLGAQDPSTAINRQLVKAAGAIDQHKAVTWVTAGLSGPYGFAELDVQLIPVGPRKMLEWSLDGTATKIIEDHYVKIAEASIAVGQETVWAAGALTKGPVDHGQSLLRKYPELCRSVAVTDGNAGTAAIVLKQIKRAGFRPGFRVAVIGAYGAIGRAVARGLVPYRPELICLVGPDKPEKLALLEEVAREVKELVPPGQATAVVYSQNEAALKEYDVGLVVIATNSKNISRDVLPAGCLALDMTTPASCDKNPSHDDGKLVVAGGCVSFPAHVLHHFRDYRGKVLLDIGAGGVRCVWGCMGQAIAMALLGPLTHRIGPRISDQDMEWCEGAFALLGAEPQAWGYLGDMFPEERVLELVQGKK